MLDDVILENISAGPYGANVVADSAGVRFSVSATIKSLPTNPSQDTPSQRWTRLNQRLAGDEPTSDEEYGIVSSAMIETLRSAGSDHFLTFATCYQTAPPSPRLSDHLFPPIFHLNYTDHFDETSRTCRGVLRFTDLPNRYFPTELPDAYPGAEVLKFVIPHSLPEYAVDEVEVLESLVHSPEADHIACRVLVRGEEMLCKAERGGVAFGDSVVGQDFGTMLRIHAAREDSAHPLSLRVPLLRGFLRHPVEGHVVGFLRDWVPGASLDAHDADDVPVAQRREWDSKVTATICKLHDLNVHWGVPKAESVIIDGEGEPWLIDFGSGVNSGTRRENIHAQEGDWEDYDDVFQHMNLINKPLGSAFSASSPENGFEEDSGLDCGDSDSESSDNEMEL